MLVSSSGEDGLNDDTMSVASAPAASISDRQMELQRRTSSRKRRAYYLMRSSMDDVDKMNVRQVLYTGINGISFFSSGTSC
jgi:hypothetical protein